MITVHHLNNSRSQRILWLLEELGVEYQIQRYERDPKTMLAPPELRAIHPLGKSPVLTDGDLTLAESGAIIDYLASRYSESLLPPAGTPERLRCNYWLHYAEGSAMPPLLLKLVFVNWSSDYHKCVVKLLWILIARRQLVLSYQILKLLSILAHLIQKILARLKNLQLDE